MQEKLIEEYIKRNNLASVEKRRTKKGYWFWEAVFPHNINDNEIAEKYASDIIALGAKVTIKGAPTYRFLEIKLYS